MRAALSPGMTETLNILTRYSETIDDARALAEYARVTMLIARLRGDVDASQVLAECDSSEWDGASGTDAETVCAKGTNR